MNSLFLYPRLAAVGIRKNGRLYFPYILTGIGMVMIYYIVSFLSTCSMIGEMRGGEIMQEMLSLGVGVMAVFSAIFMFYTNSFLIRRRKREFGLYNILGMGKGNLMVVMLWETLITYAVTMTAGLALGILASKACELAAINILGGDTNYGFEISPDSIIYALIIFAVIFLLIFMNTLRQVAISKPAELIGSESAGERPPKANWLAAVLGALLLALAYGMAIAIKDPLEALFYFFIAVILVIIASYLLFIAGSVALCKALQKNKRYYYHIRHFVSVSQMAYRMKKNGAGLASICILSTMLLVTLSSTICLYAGEEETLSHHYPRDIEVCCTAAEPIDKPLLESAVEKSTDGENAVCTDILTYSYTSFGGLLVNDRLGLDVQDSVTEGTILLLVAMTAEDYNQLTGAQAAPAKGEALIYSDNSDYGFETLNIADKITLKTSPAPVPVTIQQAAVSIASSLYAVVDSTETLMELYALQSDIYGEQSSPLYSILCFNSDEGFCADEKELQDFEHSVFESLRELSLGFDFSVSVSGKAVERMWFNSLYGGLFLLGIILGIVFLSAAVLIMYYKQISEGYEDSARFDILRKVGMTDSEIKQSINSQVLTVFFLPLFAAGMHTGFAFPIIYRLLRLFGFTDSGFFAVIMFCCFAVFAAFYLTAYLLTSKSYFRIVSGNGTKA